MSDMIQKSRMSGVSLTGRWVAAALALAALGWSGEALAQSRQFICSEASTLTVQVENADTIAATLGFSNPRRLRQRDGGPYTFADNRVELRIARNQKGVRIRQAGQEDIHCIYPIPAAINGGFDSVAGVQAKSWGGIVRSGPGMEHQKVASLREGDPIVLEERSDVEMNGFPWFRITFNGNQTGFQWGGIICPVGQPVPGTFQQCN